MTRPPWRSQAVRTLSQPTRPGGHPLRALRTGAAQPVLPAREWASISALADPVSAREGAVSSMVAEWQWTPLPAAAAFARMVTASGILGALTRLLLVAGAHAERCAWRVRGRAPRGPRGALAALTLRPALPCSRPRSAPGAELNTELLSFGADGARGAQTDRRARHC